ncbi:MAG: AMP-binding protein [Paracoccaceae bacterium]|nr:AMP-binding protein [Paracoccaceae bacterium]
MSYLRGPNFPSLVDRTIPEQLEKTVSKFGNREALVFYDKGIRLSYDEFYDAVKKLAAGMLALGLSKGDRVGIWSPNRLEWVLTQFATSCVGLILVNINPAYRLSELEYVLNKVGCKALISAKSFKTSDYVGMIRKLAPELESCRPGKLQSSKLPDLQSIVVMDDVEKPGMFSFTDLMQLGGPDQEIKIKAINKTLCPDEAINIQFTSGTTGLPKGATLSHKNIVNNARFVVDRIRLQEVDRLAIPVPLYHCFGMVMGVLGAMSCGAAMIFPSESFNASNTLDALSDERCTAVYGVPTMFLAMLEDLENSPRDVSCLRTGIMAGAPCPIEIMKRVNNELNLNEITICYGMTETSPVSFQSFVDDPIDKRCETVGRVHPHLEVKIIDLQGEVVPVGVKGELCTKGYSVMKGYWEDEEKTDESIINGWMHSGDLAIIDDEGFCNIVGRVKDMIIRGGENVYPREIEEYLIRHPKVNDVQVFGIPDEKLGESVCAWIITKPGMDLNESELKEYCNDNVAYFKIPSHFKFVEEFPMTVTGKPQKFLMREKMVEMLEDG